MVLEIGVPKTWACHGNTNDSIIPSLSNQAGSSLIFLITPCLSKRLGRIAHS